MRVSPLLLHCPSPLDVDPADDLEAIQTTSSRTNPPLSSRTFTTLKTQQIKMVSPTILSTSTRPVDRIYREGDQGHGSKRINVRKGRYGFWRDDRESWRSKWSKGVNAAEGSDDGQSERAGNSERIVLVRRIVSGSGSGSGSLLGSRRIDRNRRRPLEIDNTRIASMVDHYKDSLDLQIHPKINHSTSLSRFLAPAIYLDKFA
jgi:hypothetical protein